MQVLALPPSDSCSNRVSLESLYGMCPWWSTKAVMTRPSVNKLWLMLPASRARSLLAPDRPTHSDLYIHNTNTPYFVMNCTSHTVMIIHRLRVRRTYPARSTKFN